MRAMLGNEQSVYMLYSLVDYDALTLLWDPFRYVNTTYIAQEES